MQIVLFVLGWLALFFMFRTVALRRWPQWRGERIEIASFGLAMLVALISFRILLAVSERPAGPDFKAELERLKAEAKVMPPPAAFDTTTLRGVQQLEARGSAHDARAAFIRASAQTPRPDIAIRTGSDRDLRYLIILRDTIRFGVQRQVKGSRGQLEWVQYPLEVVRLEVCKTRERECTPVSPDEPAREGGHYRIAGRPAGTELFPISF